MVTLNLGLEGLYMCVCVYVYHQTQLFSLSILVLQLEVSSLLSLCSILF